MSATVFFLFGKWLDNYDAWREFLQLADTCFVIVSMNGSCAYSTTCDNEDNETNSNQNGVSCDVRQNQEV